MEKGPGINNKTQEENKEIKPSQTWFKKAVMGGIGLGMGMGAFANNRQENSSVSNDLDKNNLYEQISPSNENIQNNNKIADFNMELDSINSEQINISKKELRDGLEKQLKNYIDGGYWVEYINVLFLIKGLDFQLPQDVSSNLEKMLKEYARRGYWSDYVNIILLMKKLGIQFENYSMDFNGK